MELGKIRPTATLVAQFPGGVEVDAIKHEGKIYLPILSSEDFTATGGKKSSPSPVEDAPSKESKSGDKKYSENELMDMDVKELSVILKKEFGVNPDDYEGKNTNKKLRNLILDAQNGTLEDGDSEGDEPEEKEEPKKSKKPAKSDEDEEGEDDDASGDTAEKVADILQQFDSGSKNRKKTIAALCEINEDADEDKISKAFSEFEDDDDADINDVAKKIASIIDGKPAKSSKSKSKSGDEDLVDAEDLEVGDKVSVYWKDDENDDWFEGTVKAIKKGRVLVHYDDDTEEYIDSKINPKIKKLS